MKTRFEWDAQKAARNYRKHGVTFEEAASVFKDDFAISKPERIENGEERWQTIGLSKNALLLTIAHTQRFEMDDTEVVRIISARRLDKKERESYENG